MKASTMSCKTNDLDSILYALVYHSWTHPLLILGNDIERYVRKKGSVGVSLIAAVL